MTCVGKGRCRYRIDGRGKSKERVRKGRGVIDDKRSDKKHEKAKKGTAVSMT